MVFLQGTKAKNGGEVTSDETSSAPQPFQLVLGDETATRRRRQAANVKDNVDNGKEGQETLLQGLDCMRRCYTALLLFFFPLICNYVPEKNISEGVSGDVSADLYLVWHF